MTWRPRAIATSRTCYAMASDGLFFQRAADVHPTYRTPHVAILMTCGWAALLTLTGSYEQLFTWVTFASVAFGFCHLWFRGFPNWRFAIVAAVAGWFYGKAYERGQGIRAAMVTHALAVTVWQTLSA